MKIILRYDDDSYFYEKDIKGIYVFSGMKDRAQIFDISEDYYLDTIAELIDNEYLPITIEEVHE
jgi:hypothetical protein